MMGHIVCAFQIPAMSHLHRTFPRVWPECQSRVFFSISQKGGTSQNRQHHEGTHQTLEQIYVSEIQTLNPTHRTFCKIEMAKKYPVDFEAAARTPSSRASKQAPT